MSTERTEASSGVRDPGSRPTRRAGPPAIGVFAWGSGGMVAAAYLSRILRDASAEERSYLAFSRERPAVERYKALELGRIVITRNL